MTMPQTRHYEMKDSGVEWIGKMPTEWKCSRVGNFFYFTSGDTLTSEGMSAGQYVVYGANGIRGYHSDFNLDGKYILLGRVGALCGNVHLVNQKAWVTEHALITHKKCKCIEEFYQYVFKAMNLGQYSKASAQPVISSTTLMMLRFPVPPLSEQTAIAAYLDEKCATIDAIIAEAKSSIEEYKSWKASVIFETVTKGLNPNAEMKDSGVEWIGEIPKGWKVSAVKRHYSITLGKMLESVPQSNDATLENYMCASNVKWGGIDTTTNRQMWFSPIEKEEYLLKEGDLLVMEGGATAGTSTIYHGEFTPCYMQNSVNRCRSKDGSLPTFLYYWLFFVNHKGHIDSLCNCATFKHLTKEKLGCLPFVYVPKEEQASIVSYLDRECSLIDGIILEKEDLIRELETYKRSLIFEVVTGKRRVC